MYGSDKICIVGSWHLHKFMIYQVNGTKQFIQSPDSLTYNFFKYNWCEMVCQLHLYITYAFLPKNMTEHFRKAYLFLMIVSQHQKEKIWAFHIGFPHLNIIKEVCHQDTLNISSYVVFRPTFRKKENKGSQVVLSKVV